MLSSHLQTDDVSMQRASQTQQTALYQDISVFIYLYETIFSAQM